MATYLILNLLFLSGILLTLKVFGALHWTRNSLYVLVLLLVLTAIFDSLIIATGIVDYDTSKLLGLYVGFAPIEDFAYTFLVVLMIPSLWKKLGDRRAH